MAGDYAITTLVVALVVLSLLRVWLWSLQRPAWWRLEDRGIKTSKGTLTKHDRKGEKENEDRRCH